MASSVKDRASSLGKLWVIEGETNGKFTRGQSSR
jgi:hypothetical protein